MSVVDLKKFSILQYGEYYKCVKICSITHKQYVVKLTKDEFLKYYLPKGKNVGHLTKMNSNDKLFLETTLTPEEIKCIPEVVRKKVTKNLWKFRLREKS